MDETWEKYRKHLLNEGLSDHRINKLRYVYGTVKKHIGQYEKADREIIENFIHGLNENSIISPFKGKEYSGSTKADFKKFLKQFYKWYSGDNEFYPKNVSWIKARIRKDEAPTPKDVMTITDVLKLSGSFSRSEYRALCLLLFDSGFRIGEMLSVKKADLTFEDFEPGKKCYWIKCNKSKTIPRKVPVSLFSDQIREFMSSPYFLSRDDNALLFGISAPVVRNTIRLRANIVLAGKHITPHCFRHSSATHYAKILNGNLFALCERYGWSFSSDEAKCYVRASGQYQIEGAKQAYNDELGQLREKLASQEERMIKLQEAFLLLEQLQKNPEMRARFENAG